MVFWRPKHVAANAKFGFSAVLLQIRIYWDGSAVLTGSYQLFEGQFMCLTLKMKVALAYVYVVCVCVCVCEWC
jgi:hypothetical protein